MAQGNCWKMSNLSTALHILGIKSSDIFSKILCLVMPVPFFYIVLFPFAKTYRSQADYPRRLTDDHEPPLYHADSLHLTPSSGTVEVQGFWKGRLGKTHRQKQHKLVSVISQTANQNSWALNECLTFHSELSGLVGRRGELHVSAYWCTTDSEIFWETDLLWKLMILEVVLYIMWNHRSADLFRHFWCELQLCGEEMANFLTGILVPGLTIW